MYSTSSKLISFFIDNKLPHKRIKATTLEVISTDYTGSLRLRYHIIKATSTYFQIVLHILTGETQSREQ
jgi:hypothetical protein